MNRLKVEAYRLVGQTPDVCNHRGAQRRALVTGQQVGQSRDIVLQQTGSLARGSHSPSIDSKILAPSALSISGAFAKAVNESRSRYFSWR